jgi:hypothetical protein
LNQRDQQFAETVPTGAAFDVTVKRFDPTDWLLLATRIPHVLREWNRIVRNVPEHRRALATARIVGTTEFNDRQVFVAVDWKDNDDVLCRFSVPKQWLIDRKIIAEGTEPLPGTTLLVGAYPSDEKETLKIPESMKLLEDDQEYEWEAMLEKACKTIGGVEWNERAKRITSRGMPVSVGDRDKLLRLFADREWTDQVWNWWCQTHTLEKVKIFSARSHSEDGTRREGNLRPGEAIDKAQRRVQSSVRTPQRRPAPTIGQVLRGRVSNIKPYGVFLDLGCYGSGLVHISEITDGYVADIGDHVKEGEEVRARVLDVAPDGKIRLSMRDVNDEG